jgi:sarcosine oxidase
MNTFDVIVIGVGSMGSSACYHLAHRGYKVLGFEQFDITHEFGSHAGQSRIIRKAYFENSDYVPLLNRAYENWKAFERETGEQLYFPTGLVYFGSPAHPLMKGVKRSSSLYNIKLDQLNSNETSQLFHQFKIPDHFETLFEPDAGFVTPEKTIKLYSKQAIKKGAEIRAREKVLNWKKDQNEIIVTTDKNIYRCNKLIITAGAWAGKMIPSLSKKLRITRQFIAWLKPKNWSDFALDRFPCWLLADDKRPGCYYGFPILPEDKFGEPTGLKIAHHYPATEADPDNVNRQVKAEDEEDLKYIFEKYFNGDFEILSYKICLYANSPDEDFIIDKLPGYEDKIIIACGFSGHGFKFVPVIGEILADLAINNKTSLPVGFLNAERIFA